ncbi:LacI family transcriptional regulator [Pokkaliibacter plantistimulans]|uniref:LacI family transcriptional regulator n=1 Tax=Proteobacteria bacterium 228 TaxID=2083153 RepID=A0A2S5KNI0_9PROT|nr:sugar-binding transcriptional regulator [Pokkaliibacter plantistimulans]PPC76407.1 LacI family transcriptional regulator [Pokkaliibacter plantistimulans]
MSNQEKHSTIDDSVIESSGSNSSRLRLRAAWMYFVEGMTQNDIAKQLGLGRVTVLRMLATAKEQQEVKISIDHGLADCVRLERALEQRFDIGEVIVVPLSEPDRDAAIPISAATGRYVSSIIRPHMKIGVGWGRTLLSSLSFMPQNAIEGLSVVSMLGGIMKASKFNPAEFAWRFADTFNAECFLMTAPALVDSPETRERLVSHCGLHEVFNLAETLDAVLLSAGAMLPDATYRRIGMISAEEQEHARQQGAVGDMMLHFYNVQGELVDSPLNDRVMSVPLPTLAKVPIRILSSGGMEKVEAMLGAIRMLKPTVLITDEWAAAKILSMTEA